MVQFGCLVGRLELKTNPRIWLCCAVRWNLCTPLWFSLRLDSMMRLLFLDLGQCTSDLCNIMVWVGRMAEKSFLQVSVFCTHLLAAKLQRGQNPWSWHGSILFWVCTCQEFDSWFFWPPMTGILCLGLRLWPGKWFFWHSVWRAEVARHQHEWWIVLDFETPLMSPCRGLEKFCVLVEIWVVKVENFPTQTLHVENLGVFCTSPKLAHVQGAPVRLLLTLLPKLLYSHAP